MLNVQDKILLMRLRSEMDVALKMSKKIKKFPGLKNIPEEQRKGMLDQNEKLVERMKMLKRQIAPLFNPVNPGLSVAQKEALQQELEAAQQGNANMVRIFEVIKKKYS